MVNVGKYAIHGSYGYVVFTLTLHFWFRTWWIYPDLYLRPGFWCLTSFFDSGGSLLSLRHRHWKLGLKRHQKKTIVWTNHPFSGCELPVSFREGNSTRQPTLASPAVTLGSALASNLKKRYPPKKFAKGSKGGWFLFFWTFCWSICGFFWVYFHNLQVIYTLFP